MRGSRVLANTPPCLPEATHQEVDRHLRLSATCAKWLVVEVSDQFEPLAEVPGRPRYSPADVEGNFRIGMQPGLKLDTRISHVQRRLEREYAPRRLHRRSPDPSSSVRK